MYISFAKNSIDRLPNTLKNILGNKEIILKITGLFPYKNGILGLKGYGIPGFRDPWLQSLSATITLQLFVLYL